MQPTENVSQLPRGPEGSVQEQLARFNQNPYAYLEEMERQYGSMFTLRLGNLGNDHVVNVEYTGNWVFLCRPHQTRLMYEAGDAVVSGAFANKVFFGTNEASVGYIDSKAHKCRRSQLHPFLNGSRDYSALVLETLDRRVARWPRGTQFSLFQELQYLTLDVILEVVCGNMDQEARASLHSMMLKTENARYTREEVLDADKAVRAFVQQRLDGYLEKAVAAGKEDILASLLRLGRDGDEALSNEVVRDEVFSLLYTGFSTTANTLSWAFVRILGDERVREKLTAEVNEVLGGRSPTRQDVNKMPYLEATLQETLRLHPVTPLNGVRMVKQPLEIDGHLIPAGTVLVHCAYLLQRSPEVYPDPEKFLPERFLGKRPDPYAWGAFGGGSRICIGRGFSLEEMRLILAKLMSSELRMERVGGLPGAKQQGFFMAPEDGARCIIKAERTETALPAA